MNFMIKGYVIQEKKELEKIIGSNKEAKRYVGKGAKRKTHPF